MTARIVAAESESLRAIAKANGRVKCPVFLYFRTDEHTPVAVEDLNLASSVDRDRFLSRLPLDQQDEASGLLGRLAASVTASSAAIGNRNSESDQSEGEPLEPWDAPVDGSALLDSLASLVFRYMVMAPEEVAAVVLWYLHTYLVDAADYSPYILITSPVRECGKSTLEDLSENIAFRARKTDGITGPALYRVIEKSQPTMLIDELDTRLRGDTGEGLRGVLNSGFKRGGSVDICAGDEHEVRKYSTFCPKMLAGIGKPWDTVTSRSIPVRLARATKEQLAGLSKIRGHLIADECLPYRRKLLRLADDIRVTVRVTDPVTPDELGARQTDVWRPLLAIADAIGGHWVQTARAAAVQLHSVPEEEGDYGLLLLQDVRDLFAELNARELASDTIEERLVAKEDRPWPEYRNDRPITKNGIARLLKRFGIRPKTIRFPDKVAKGYELCDLRPSFERYLPAGPSTPEQSVTTVTTRSATTSGARC